MTEQAQNAFLLLLESPPPYAMFFLICKNAVSLLETVRSRAPTLRMERLDRDLVRDYLLKHERRAGELDSESPDELDLAVFAGEGSIGASIALLDTKKRNAVAESREIARKMIRALNSRDKAQAYSLIASLGSKRAEICRHLSYLEVALRDLILIKKSEHVRLCFFDNEEEAFELSSCFSLSSLFGLYDATATAISSLEANTNVRLTLTFMMQSAGIL
jgi:DNA polymerase III gamma/tau subunit